MSVDGMWVAITATMFFCIAVCIAIWVIKTDADE